MEPGGGCCQGRGSQRQVTTPERSGLAGHEHSEEGCVITSANASVSTWLAAHNRRLHHIHAVQPEVGSD